MKRFHRPGLPWQIVSYLLPYLPCGIPLPFPAPCLKSKYGIPFNGDPLLLDSLRYENAAKRNPFPSLG